VTVEVLAEHPLVKFREACVRCPMRRMDPTQLPRLLETEHDTQRLLAEAQQQGWDGEAAGLTDTLVHIADKKAQLQRIQTNSAGSTTQCG
jgi:hypothetical protein